MLTASYFIALPQLMMKSQCPRNVSEIARNVASRLSLSCFASNLIVQDSTIRQTLNIKMLHIYLFFFSMINPCMYCKVTNGKHKQ